MTATTLPRWKDKIACFADRIVCVRLGEPCYDLQAFNCMCVVYKSAIFVLWWRLTSKIQSCRLFLGCSWRILNGWFDNSRCWSYAWNTNDLSLSLSRCWLTICSSSFCLLLFTNSFTCLWVMFLLRNWCRSICNSWFNILTWAFRWQIFEAVISVLIFILPVDKRLFRLNWSMFPAIWCLAPQNRLFLRLTGNSSLGFFCSCRLCLCSKFGTAIVLLGRTIVTADAFALICAGHSKLKALTVAFAAPRSFASAAFPMLHCLLILVHF